MERLKLFNVLKSTFLGSEFHTYTCGTRCPRMCASRVREAFLLYIYNKNASLTRDAQSFFCTTYIYDRAEGRIFSSKKLSLSK